MRALAGFIGPRPAGRPRVLTGHDIRTDPFPPPADSGTRHFLGFSHTSALPRQLQNVIQARRHSRICCSFICALQVSRIVAFTNDATVKESKSGPICLFVCSLYFSRPVEAESRVLCRLIACLSALIALRACRQPSSNHGSRRCC